LEDEYNSHIYRFVQESLNNVAKHAKATEVFVVAGCLAGQLKICVVDNGIGRHVTDTKGFGMRSMQERAHMMGGELTVVSQPDKGLSLSLNVPLKEVT
jgi:two-component system sensor histidine kinase UhpB